MSKNLDSITNNGKLFITQGSLMLTPRTRRHRYFIFYTLDVLSIFLSFLTIHLFTTGIDKSAVDGTNILYLSITILVMPLIHLSVGLYDTKIRQDVKSMFKRAVLSTVLLFLFLISLLAFFVKSPTPYLSISIALSLTVIIQTIWRTWAIYYDGVTLAKRHIVFMGAGDRASFITSRMRRDVDRKNFIFGGFLPLINSSLNECRINKDIASSENVITPPGSDNYAEIVSKLHSDVIVLCNDKDEKLPLKALINAKMQGVEIIEMEDFIEAELGQLAVENVRAGWILNSRGFKVCRYGFSSFNYCFNFLIAVLVLSLSWPLMILAAIAIYLDDGKRDQATFLYKQVRVGLNGKNFDIFKFRSMGKDAEKNGAQWSTIGDSRVTRVGKYLRKYRIDEIPQLINVFKGEMCFVGPRPERPQFVEELTKVIPYFDYRHCVKPGLTGWAQIKYPYGASEKDSLEKLKFDLYYIKHKNFFLDLLVLLKTVEIVLFGNGR
jgi:sugar transferase (PEP-CTERM system associated)